MRLPPYPDSARAVHRFLNQPHFFGEAPERRPWAIKREDRPAAFAGRSISRFFLPSVCWNTAVAYTGEYPIPCPHQPSPASAPHVAENLRNQPENNLRMSRGTTAAHYTGTEERFPDLLAGCDGCRGTAKERRNRSWKHTDCTPSC